MLAALLLNLVVLAPGEALYLPAGNLHAYLSGAGVELMANSDNVLRGGLTSKHVDVAELLRVLDFTPRTPPVLHGVDDGGWVRYDTDAAEFLLRRLEGAPEGRPGRRARRWPADPAVHARLGAGRAAGGDPLAGQEQTLGRGQALWLAADDRDVTVAPQEAGTPAVPGRRRIGRLRFPSTRADSSDRRGWSAPGCLPVVTVRRAGRDRKRRRAACRRAAERRRSSRRCWRTPASRWRSSSATW